jgi:RNA polymerase sigma factor (sigma-70 family)
MAGHHRPEHGAEMDDGDYPITPLVAAAAAGDERAWNEIVDRYAPLLASVIRPFRLTTAETQDVAQTVWLRLVEHLSSLREPRALPMWIITTGKREALRYLSNQRWTLPYDPLDPSWLATSAEDAEPDAELLRAEQHEALLAGLAELPARQRELLLLLVEDPPLSYAQISRRTGVPIGSIGPTRARAMERLRQTCAVRDHLTGPARVPVVSHGAARLDRGAPPDLDRPQER